MHVLNELRLFLPAHLYSSVGLFLFFMLLAPFVHAGVKVVIETSQPHDDFVIRCQWHSDFLNLHGGSNLVKEKVFINSSGKETDCGWSLFGEGPFVDVMHPLYTPTNGCAYGSHCNTQYSHYENDVIFIKPLSIEKYLDQLELKYTGKELLNNVSDFCAVHFNSTHGDQLKQFWARAALVGRFKGRISDPENAIASYLRKIK